MCAIAIIVAGGNATRAKSEIPKQFVKFAGKSLIQYSVDAFEAHPMISNIIIALSKDYYDFEILGSKVIKTTGGAIRSDSVGKCLEIAKKFAPNKILIHDAARPGIRSDIIESLLEALEGFDGAFPALKIPDAIWKCDLEGMASKPIDRDSLVRAQTPQAFIANKYFQAFDNRNLQSEFLDDVQIAAFAGLNIKAIDGSKSLSKITFPEDFEDLEHILKGRKTMTRTGTGFDAHRFCDGEFVTICGHKIPHSNGLEGHSDADVAWHALVDAILGAIGEGDIGRAFPPSDAKWKNAPSSIFLEFAASKVKEIGAKINNVDLTIICESPRISPFNEIISQNTAKILGIELNQVNIKATTTEKMGFTGRKEGIAAHAIATIEV